MKFIKFLLVGIVFGIVLVKSEAVSWYRIYEMFRFQSFHMYGIIGTAITSGVLFLQLSKRSKLKTINGAELFVPKKERGLTRYIVGGIIFGLGWAMTGACPGPLYVLFGNGISVIIVVLAGAVFGTLVYGAVRKYLPH